MFLGKAQFCLRLSRFGLKPTAVSAEQPSPLYPTLEKGEVYGAFP